MGFKTLRVPCLLLLAGLFASISFPTSAAESPAAPDSFGYTVQAQAFNWVSITGTTVSFPSPDNSFTITPVTLPFNFPFFENNYNQVYISTNGTLSFGQGMLTPINQVIPLSAPPDNFIAPLWTDLDVSTGNVRYEAKTTPNRFVVTWEGVTHVDTPASPLDFQAILHENGDICFQYQTLTTVPSNFTAGIEDIHGVDGLENSGGVAVSAHFCFIHPGAAARVKITPDYNGGLLAKGLKDFEITVYNTGGLGADTYNLDFISSSPGWTVQFIQSDTLAGQLDSPLSDTGPIPQGGSVDISLRVHAPPGAVAGDFSQLTISATSQLNGSVSSDSFIQAAVPADFTQLYFDSQTGFRLQMYSERATFVTPNIFSGVSGGHSMVRASDGSLFAFWVYTYVNSESKPVSDLKYSIFSPLGYEILGDVDLTYNNGESIVVFDENPAAAATSSGLVGVAYIENRVNILLETNSNVFLHILDNQGSTVAGPINLTQNNVFGGENDLDVPRFDAPRITTAGGNFVVTWTDNRKQSGLLEENDVWLAIRNNTGGPVYGPNIAADSNAGGDLYIKPTVAGLASGHTLLAYSITDNAGIFSGIEYAVFASNGNPIKPATSLGGALGDGLDAAQLSSGNTLISWIDPGSDQVEYAMLDSNYNLLAGPNELTTPSNRTARYTSVTATQAGYGVLTWMDALATQYIYYALVDGFGSLVTSPMAIRSSTGTATILSSFNGGGNAGYKTVFPIYMPVVVRN